MSSRDRIFAPHLTPASPFPARLWAFLGERFPPFTYGILIISYFSSNQFLAHALTVPGEPMHYSLRSLLGALLLLCFFFHLRVFDEHKDYADDCRFYPQRVLQRGIITLRELKILGGLAIAYELLLGLVLGPPVLLAVLLVLGFSLLMLKEFFMSAWLKPRFLLYAVLHLLIMPLFAIAIFCLATGRHLWQAPAWFWLYALVGVFVTFNWEISRKIRAPEEEIDGVDSYSRILGRYGSAYAVLFMRVIDTALVMLVGWHLGLSIWFYALLILLFLICLIGFFQYRFHTTPATARRMEVYAGMYIIAFDLILAVELARQCGLGLVL